MGHEPAGLEHLARDLGVDAFVPVGEAVVAEKGEDAKSGEQCGEECRAEGLANAESVLGVGCRGHEETIREVLRRGRTDGAIDLAGWNVRLGWVRRRRSGRGGSGHG